MAIVQGGRYVLLSMFHGIGNADDDARVNTYTESILPEGSLSTDFLLDGRNLDERTSKLFRSIENTSEKRQSRKLLTVYSTIQEAANELDVPVRFDVAEVYDEGGSLRISYIENAFI